MKADRIVPGILSDKQYIQLLNLVCRTQSYLPFPESQLVTLVEGSSKFCLRFECTSIDWNKRFKEGLEGFKRKYYLDGFKENKGLFGYQRSGAIKEFLKQNNIRFLFHWKTTPYQPIERVALIKTVRACRDYIYSGMTDEGADKLIENLNDIRHMVNG
jgi:hypothetical protein